MIIYDLKCEKKHRFEGWFDDRAAFEAQKSGKFISCPVCGSTDIEIIPSTVAVLGKDTRNDAGDKGEIYPLKAAQILHEYLNTNFDDVGDRFAEVALRIHKGEEEKRNIKGTTTKEEEETLRETGVQFFKVTVPKLDS